ncbi:NAD(P)/FAD-dependent oxidoreductase [Roseomonas fluvialis]|uniref:FAD-dependent oxidoreductase n=1 Tax=Roseomonas fluvialis TaxID=1750527 RepID=A0ABN6NZ74_9PROT|nr:FAD-binding oxidoreductase [Roseomonas fluvialis]BDG71728.1 FAD-dependent oxidoreductase [Roseomonas fluvialis]
MNYDVIIVGGGGMGSSAAVHLAQSPNGARVAVIERDPTYIDAQTWRANTGGIRRTHSLPENIALSQYSIEYYRDFAAHTEVDGIGTDAEFVPGGYVMTASPAGIANLAVNFELQTTMGVDVRWLEPSQAASQFPMLRQDHIGAAVHSPADGWANPQRVLEGLRRKAVALGVDYLVDEAMVFERAGRRISSVTLASGRTLRAPTIVLAAGPWSGLVAKKAGVTIPVGPLLRHDFDFEVDAPSAPQPFIRDWARIAFRPEGRGYRGGAQTTATSRSFDFAADPNFFETMMRPALTDSLHGFEGVRQVGAVTGLFDFNALDQNAIIGPCSGTLDNLYLLTGFSGHGFMHAPGAGRAIAELIIHGEFRTIDLTRLGWQRVVDGKPYLDRKAG